MGKSAAGCTQLKVEENMMFEPQGFKHVFYSSQKSRSAYKMKMLPKPTGSFLYCCSPGEVVVGMPSSAHYYFV